MFSGRGFFLLFNTPWEETEMNDKHANNGNGFEIDFEDSVSGKIMKKQPKVSDVKSALSWAQDFLANLKNHTTNRIQWRVVRVIRVTKKVAWKPK
jgi:hypothetical protein